MLTNSVLSASKHLKNFEASSSSQKKKKKKHVCQSSKSEQIKLIKRKKSFNLHLQKQCLSFSVDNQCSEQFLHIATKFLSKASSDFLSNITKIKNCPAKLWYTTFSNIKKSRALKTSLQKTCGHNIERCQLYKRKLGFSLSPKYHEIVKLGSRFALTFFMFFNFFPRQNYQCKITFFFKCIENNDFYRYFLSKIYAKRIICVSGLIVAMYTTRR